MAVKVSKVKSISLRFEADAEKTLRATISITKASSFKNYKYKWKYWTRDGKSYSIGKSGSSSSSSLSETVPDNAIKVSLTVTPRDKVGKKTTTRKPYTKNINVLSETMEVPPTPDVSIISVDGDKVTIALSISQYRDQKATFIDFWARETKFGQNESAWINISKMLEISGESVYTTWSDMRIGYDYEFASRAISADYVSKTNTYKNFQYSEWSDWSSTISGQYPAPGDTCFIAKYRDGRGIAVGITLPEASRRLLSEIQLIRDDQNPDDPFDWANVDKLPPDYIVSLADEANPKYFTELGPYRYRIRARIVGDVEGRGTQSAWRMYDSYLDSFEKHEAPTIWTNSSKYELNKKIDFYWMANSTDGSRELSAEVWRLYSNDNGETFTTDSRTVIPNTIPLLDDVSAHTMSSRVGRAGVYRWQVRTTNVNDPTEEDWSEWSTTKEFKVYGKPIVSIFIENNEVSDQFHFPINGRATISNAGGQILMYYTLKIVSVNRYVEEHFNSTKVINANSSLYSKVVDVSEEGLSEIEFTILPNDVRLTNDQEYSIVFDATFDSGLTESDSYTFLYNSGDTDDEVDIGLMSNEYDPESATIILKPEVLINEEESTDFDVSVYRIAYDGEAVLLNPEPYRSGSGETILDPHPTLNDCTYQILAINRNTGKYYYQEASVDIPDESSLVINWDESWAMDDGDETDDELRHSEDSYGGNILKLMYNIERSYQNNKDVVLVEYIGRRNPVSYYGTQQGYTMSWNTDVPYDDMVTIELLDQLMAYDGDCYVREASGKGFWANLKISYSHKSGELKYAVSIAVTKVEGGA